ncbi:MAG: hypothetical protein OXG24_04285 [Gammaproteobacteria bacterium]|nr:hypothetical protein [Gammaproteobacteria bacterium]
MANLENLRLHLDGLAVRGAGYLRRYALKNAVEKAMGHVHIVALIVPLAFVVIALADRFAGTQVWVLNPILTVLLALVVPIVYILLAAVFGFVSRKVSRNFALALFDRELGYKDRLQAADEFLNSSSLSEFESAAVADAIPYAEKATNTRLQDIKIAAPAIYTTKWGHGVVAVVFLVAGILVQLIAFNPNLEANPVPEELVALNTVEDLVFEEETVEAPMESEDETQSPPQNVSTDRTGEGAVLESQESKSQDSALRKANPSDSDPSESMQVGLSGGASQDNKAGSSSSSLSGEGDPEKKQQESKEPPKDRENKEKKERPDEDEPGDESAKGIAGGKGSGSGRQSSSAEMTENTSRPLENDFDTGVDLESDDEEDEKQEATSAARPMINQRKPPVDRQLSPSGMVGQEEDERANGRGGAGARKKTRGVAAMLLGVPMPDQLRSQVSPGRVKIQRERSVPHPSQVASVDSKDRGSIDESIGKVAHHELKPWMRNVVSNYFTSMRRKPTEEGE